MGLKTHGWRAYADNRQRRAPRPFLAAEVTGGPTRASGRRVLRSPTSATGGGPRPAGAELDRVNRKIITASWARLVLPGADVLKGRTARGLDHELRTREED